MRVNICTDRSKGHVASIFLFFKLQLVVLKYYFTRKIFIDMKNRSQIVTRPPHSKIIVWKSSEFYLEDPFRVRILFFFWFTLYNKHKEVFNRTFQDIQTPHSKQLVDTPACQYTMWGDGRVWIHISFDVRRSHQLYTHAFLSTIT